MRYVGLDAHWRQSTYCVLDECGRKIRTRTIKGAWSDVVEDLARIRGPFAVCFEATTIWGVVRAAPATRPSGRRREPRSASTDFPLEAQERPRGRGEAREAAVPRRGAANSRSARRRAVVAPADRTPPEAGSGTGPSEEQHSCDVEEPRPGSSTRALEPAGRGMDCGRGAANGARRAAARHAAREAGFGDRHDRPGRARVGPGGAATSWRPTAEDDSGRRRPNR